MKSRLRHTYHRALVTLAGLTIFSLIISVGAWGLFITGFIEITFGWISLTFLLLFTIVLLTIWILGKIQGLRAQSFLNSDRPLVRWTYTQSEWQQIKESLWQEENNSWKLQWGCLASLLSLSGLLTGILMGWGSSWREFLGSTLAGFILGGLSGVLLGALVAGGNQLGAWITYRRKNPGQIALANNEVFANNNYFKGDGDVSYIREAKFHPGNPAVLKLSLVFPPRVRMPDEDQWIIPVPPIWVERVEEILPELITNHHS